ncbi:hypothetical protein EDD15DRAFT_2522754 [Pisolithus albus]|nr:hypothetical protein EDD15DRAFT_2522754 [Pisolithus albus]
MHSWVFLTPTTNEITPTKKVGILPTLLGGTSEPELVHTGRATEEWLVWLDTYTARIESEKTSCEWGEDFVEAGEMAAMAANSRFVPRQWLLEEVVKKVEHEPSTGCNLGKVMQTKNWAKKREERRYCGLGDRRMLGFQ